jgi:hypothetical protein
LKVLKGKTPKCWVVVLYGVPGIGKSTLAKYAPKPIFLDCEGGLDRIDCEKSANRLVDYPQLYGALRWAFDCEYETVVIDTLGSVEKILIDKILAEVNANRDEASHCKSLDCKDTFGYGSGYALLKSNWSLFIEMLFKIKEGGRNVVCIAHDHVEKFINPTGDDFDRYSLNIHKKSLVYVVSQMDGVFFAHYEKGYRKKEGSDQLIPIDTGRRVLQTVEQPFCLAKNRFNLPEKVDFTELEGAKKLWNLMQ